MDIDKVVRESLASVNLDKIAAELSGAGAGIRFGVPGSVQGSIEASKPISSAEPTDGGSIRVYGSVTVKF